MGCGCGNSSQIRVVRPNVPIRAVIVPVAVRRLPTIKPKIGLYGVRSARDVNKYRN